jgi:hypothetical protein
MAVALVFAAAGALCIRDEPSTRRPRIQPVSQLGSEIGTNVVGKAVMRRRVRDRSRWANEKWNAITEVTAIVTFGARVSRGARVPGGVLRPGGVAARRRIAPRWRTAPRGESCPRGE